MLSGLKLATQSLLGRYRNILSKIVWFYEVIGVFLQPERRLQSQFMRWRLCDKMGAQRAFTQTTARKLSSCKALLECFMQTSTETVANCAKPFSFYIVFYHSGCK